MATVLTPDSDLLSVPFSAATEFTDLADHCDRFAETLIECQDPALKMALYGRLRACLAILHPTLNDPIPPHLVDSLTLDDLPTSFPRFEPDAEQLCQYCLTLLQLLTERAQGSETQQSLTGLLCELVWFFAAKLKTPRWLCTADETCLMTILFRRKTVIPDFHLLVLMEIRHLLPSFTRSKTAKNNYSDNNLFIFTKPEL